MIGMVAQAIEAYTQALASALRLRGERLRLTTTQHNTMSTRS